jgi:hypothetical protein
LQLGNYYALAEFYIATRGRIGPLRSWLDREWHPDSTDVSQSQVHQLILQLGFPLIYTTNYDRWLERAHEEAGLPYAKVAGIGDIAMARPGVTQIVKFHGDPDDDASMVLSESSYFERMSFEGPLDIKFRSDSLARPILFIGYSLSDLNIRYLLWRLHKLWDASPDARSRPMSYLFLSRPNAVDELILRTRGVEPIVATTSDAGEGLVAFLVTLAHQALGTSPRIAGP